MIKAKGLKFIEAVMTPDKLSDIEIFANAESHAKLVNTLERSMVTGGTFPGVKTIYTPVKLIAPRQQGKSLLNDLLKRYDHIQSAIEDEMLRREYACKSCGCDTRLFGCFCDNTQ